MDPHFPNVLRHWTILIIHVFSETFENSFSHEESSALLLLATAKLIPFDNWMARRFLISPQCFHSAWHAAAKHWPKVTDESISLIPPNAQTANWFRFHFKLLHSSADWRRSSWSTVCLWKRVLFWRQHRFHLLTQGDTLIGGWLPGKSQNCKITREKKEAENNARKLGWFLVVE